MFYVYFLCLPCFTRCMFAYFSNERKSILFLEFFPPHHCVGFLFFAWHPPRRFRFCFRVRPPPRPSLTSLITPHSSQHYSSHHLSTSLITALLITPVAGAVHTAFWRSWCARGRQLARGWLSCGRRSTQSLLEELVRAVGAS